MSVAETKVTAMPGNITGNHLPEVLSIMTSNCKKFQAN
jgi:hypothetical protein